MKSYHIVAYTHQADIYCPECVLSWSRDQLREKGWTENEINEIEDYYVEKFSTIDVGGWWSSQAEASLRTLAEEWNIDYDDAYSYDSDNFPKVIFADMIEGDEYCGGCHEKIME